MIRNCPSRSSDRLAAVADLLILSSTGGSLTELSLSHTDSSLTRDSCSSVRECGDLTEDVAGLAGAAPDPTPFSSSQPSRSASISTAAADAALARQSKPLVSEIMVSPDWQGEGF